MKQRKSKLNNKNLQDKLPEHFESIEAAAEFWDTHDSSDYENYMKDVECEVELGNLWVKEKAS